jgi:uncharacterized protein YbaP (TraB family)
LSVFNSALRSPILAALAALALGACRAAPPAHPALWQIEGPHGEKAWLFGTVHALPERLDWRQGRVAEALAASDLLVLEVARIEEAPRAFAALSQSPGLPPLRERTSPALRPALDRVLRETGLGAADLDGLETWAAALTIEQALASKAGIERENGIERELVASYRRPVDQLEGAPAQLSIFDRLAEEDQRVLLDSVLRESSHPDDADLARAWARGDMAPIEAEITRGLLADPELRAALLTGRNRAWADRLGGMVRQGKHPFIAVGAGHMAGPEGLPALMAAQGWRVTRLQ